MRDLKRRPAYVKKTTEACTDVALALRFGVRTVLYVPSFSLGAYLRCYLDSKMQNFNYKFSAINYRTRKRRRHGRPCDLHGDSLPHPPPFVQNFIILHRTFMPVMVLPTSVQKVSMFQIQINNLVSFMVHH